MRSTFPALSPPSVTAKGESMQFDPELLVAKMCNMLNDLEADWIDEFAGAECELIAAGGVLEQLRERMKCVRAGECGDERDADLFALREMRLGELNDGT